MACFQAAVARELSEHIKTQEEGKLEINLVHLPNNEEVAPHPTVVLTRRTLSGTSVDLTLPAFMANDVNLQSVEMILDSVDSGATHHLYFPIHPERDLDTYVQTSDAMDRNFLRSRVSPPTEFLPPPGLPSPDPSIEVVPLTEEQRARFAEFVQRSQPFFDDSERSTPDTSSGDRTTNPENFSDYIFEALRNLSSPEPPSDASDQTTSTDVVPFTSQLNSKCELSDYERLMNLFFCISYIFRRAHPIYIKACYIISWIHIIGTTLRIFVQSAHLARMLLFTTNFLVFHFVVTAQYCFGVFTYNFTTFLLSDSEERVRMKRLGRYSDLSEAELVQLGIPPYMAMDGTSLEISEYAEAYDLTILTLYEPDFFHLLEAKAFIDVRRRLLSAPRQQEEEFEEEDFFSNQIFELESHTQAEITFTRRKKQKEALIAHRFENEDDHTPTPISGKVFNGACFYENTLLSNAIVDLDWSKVEDFMSNLGALSKKPTRDSRLIELFREYRTVRKVWKLGANGRHKLKVFLSHADFDDLEEVIRRNHQRPLWAPKLEYLPELHFPPIDPKLVNFTNNSEPTFEFVDGETEFRLGLAEVYVRSRALSLQRLRCKLNELTNNYTKREIVQIIKKSLKFWAIRGMSGDVSWVLPWLPDEWFYLSSIDGVQDKVFQLFKTYVDNFKHQVINYCFQYLNIGAMSAYEKAEYFRLRSQQFVRALQSPEVQNLFLLGKPKDEIIELVYRTKVKRMNKIVKDSAFVQSVEKIKRKDRSVAVCKARRNKYVEFEAESFAGAFCSTGCTLIGLALLFYWAKRKEIDELLKNSKKLMNGAAHQLVKLHDSLEKTEVLVTKTNKFADNLEHLFDRDSVLDQFGGAVADVKRLVQVIYYAVHEQWVLMLDSASDLILRNPSKFKNLSIDMFGSLSKHVGRLFPRTEEVEFEAESHGLEEVILSPFLTLIHAFAGNKLTPLEMRDANTRMQYMTMNARFWSDSATMFKSIVGFVGRELFNYDPFDPLHRSFVEDVMNFIKTIDEVVLLEPSMPIDVKLCQKILDARDKGVTLKNDDKFLSINAALRTLHTARFTTAERLAIKAKPIVTGSGMRPEPVGILFTGKPGVGKSQAIRWLCQALSTLDGDDFVEQHIFFGGVQKYYDGLTTQPHFVMDDSFASIEQSDRKEEALFIIKGINSIPMPLEMAQCEAKGQVFFTSSYFYMSTNLANDGFKNCNFQVGASDPEAIKRRIHISLHRTEKFDPSIPLKDMKFTVERHIGENKYVNQSMNLKDIALMIHERHELHKQWHLQNQLPNSYFSNLFKAESMYSEARDYIKSYTDLVVPTDPETFEYAFQGLIAATLAIGVGSTAYALSQFFAVPQLELESNDKLGNRYMRHHANRELAKERHATRRVYKITKFEPHSRANYDSCVSNSLSKGIVSVTAYKSGVLVDSFVGHHIKDGKILSVAHGLVPNIQRGVDMFKVKWQGNHQTIVPNDIKLARFNEQDFALFRLPDACCLPPALYKYVVPYEHDVEIPRGMSLQILSVDEDANPQFRIATKTTELPDTPEYTTNGQTFCVTSPLGYFSASSKGDSGAPVVAMAKEGRAVIVGMHMCGAKNQTGDKKLGCAIRFNKNDVDEWLKLFDTEFEPESKYIEHTLQESVEVPPVNTFPPRKHSLMKTPMFGWAGPAAKAPASLSGRAYANGLAKGCQDFQKGLFPVSKEARAFFLSTYPRIKGRRVRTVSESINGYIDSLGNKVPAMRMDTHGGYMYNPKSDHISRIDEELVANPTFLKDVLSKIARMAKGEKVDFVFYDCGKVELRTNEKVAAEKTRIFSCSPLDLTVIMGMYFGDIGAYIQSLSATHPIAVGLNVHGHEWRGVHDDLLEPGGGILAGDFAGFDGDYKYDVGMATCDVINDWYDDGPENAMVRRMIFEALLEAKHICFDFFYILTGGNPSGQRYTSITNSIGLMMMLYDVLSFDVHLRQDQFRMKVYGDDSDVGTPPGAVTYDQMTKFFKERFGMTYTHWTKKPFAGTDTIYDVGFLGRQFEWHDGQMMAPLDEVIMDQMCYYYEGRDLEQTILSSSASYFLEISHKGEEFFNRKKTLYLEAVKERMPDLYEAVRHSAYDYWYYFNGRYTDDRKAAFYRFPDASGWDKSSSRETHRVPAVNSAFVVSSPETNQTPIFVAESREGGNEYKTTDPDFAIANEPVVKSSVLGSDSLIGAQTTEIVRCPRFPLAMESARLKEIMEREVVIATFVVATTDAAGAVKARVNIPEDLLDDPVRESIFYSYRGFRAGVKFRLIASNAKTNYGMMMADWYPNHCGSTDNVANTSQRSGRDHVLIRHELNQTVELKFPWVHQYQYLDTDNFYWDEIGMLSISLMSTLSSATTDAVNTTYQLLASFEDVDLTLPCPMAEPALSKTKRRVKFQAESRNESYKKATHDTYSNLITTTKSAVTEVLTGSAAKALSHMIMLDKPSSTSLSGVPQTSFWAHDFQGSGIDNAPVAGPEQSCETANDDIFARGDETSLKAIGCTPLLMNTGSISGLIDPIEVGFLGNEILNFDGFLSNIFKYRSGGYKFKVYWSCTTQHAMRVVFYLAPETAGTSGEWEKCWHQTVDVTGPGDHEVFVADPTQGFARNMNDSGIDSWCLWMQPISFSSPLGYATPIKWAVYQAAAEDVLYYMPRDVAVTFHPESNPREEFKKEFPPLHPGMKLYAPSGVLPSTYSDIRELMKTKYCLATKAQTTALTMEFPTQYVSDADNVVWGLDMLNLLYLFRRGSVVVKAGTKDVTPGMTMMMTDQNSGTYTPYAGIASQSAPVVEMKAPFYGDTSVINMRLPNTFPENERPRFVFSPRGQMCIWGGAGDDYTVSHLMWPNVNIGFLGNSASRGMGLAYVFYST
jgi:hypothetical protein